LRENDKRKAATITRWRIIIYISNIYKYLLLPFEGRDF
jgi:hypothetical protein